ncbi:hypothetical protein TPHA_0D04280 [Tetrapisispora phaffii CBS 4417]|uniref:Uncharacterized protein n=1 Tax=Tetrapisispora phaffii (strain ATCC 24235 / CBS 4417 / NBRC 1672 / NRRL Y-8282 / UCD 70-5) TaxID=1071381 RepID=G8BRY7_TETPH|nr:hypothetical protein TPHA_0D04280 [Tetrapisispora phaffii CBS 4417]CCE63062.1 hypothetical protein TPHA_0D04280 [Tetrapisispora phaffii CBS 4417]
MNAGVTGKRLPFDNKRNRRLKKRAQSNTLHDKNHIYSNELKGIIDAGGNGARDQHDTANNKPTKDFIKVVFDELNHSLNINEVEEDEEDLLQDEYELEQLINMFKIPLFLEKFVLFTLLASLDCFLYYFTILPIRILHGLITRNKLKNNRASRISKERLIVFIIVVASLILTKLDTSKVYHLIKRQSSVKLYMLYNVLEMSDKMLSSFGQSLLNVVLSKKYNAYKGTPIQHIFFIIISIVYLVIHGYILVYQTVALNVAINSYSNSLLTLLLSIQFAELKSAIFKKFDKEGLFQITIADVVERFQIIVILTIISVRNLVARYGSSGTILPTSWTLHSTTSTTASIIIGALCGPMVSVIGSELIVDWAKHAYINKFNRIRPTIYEKFFVITYRSYISGIQKYQDRLGLPLHAYTVLSLVMVPRTIIQGLRASNYHGTQIFIVATLIFIFVMGILIVMKLCVYSILTKWGTEIKKSMRKRHNSVTEKSYVPGILSSGMSKLDSPTLDVLQSKMTKIHPSPKISKNTYIHDNKLKSLNDERKRKDEENPKSLEQVTRFKMVSKQIW